jgi:uncharacterized repeat protein (TIGR04138 family)
MSFRDCLARIIASDPRYSIDAYAFVLESLNYARQRKRRAAGRGGGKAAPSAKNSSAMASRTQRPREAEHVTGPELCEALRDLALDQFGFLAATVLAQWGVYTTSDIGDVVYNMIATGDLEKTPSDSRSDFDGVFEFESALRPKSLLTTDDN